MKSQVKKARALRKTGTDAERFFWHKVRNRQLGHKFYRQFPLSPYVADFACPGLRLIVEIDGGQHDKNEKDEIRTVALNKQGYKVVRFWNNDVLSNIEGVLVSLKQTMEARQAEMGEPWVSPASPSPHPNPLPVSTGRGD